jgi:streptogramin lyase
MAKLFFAVFHDLGTDCTKVTLGFALVACQAQATPAAPTTVPLTAASTAVPATATSTTEPTPVATVVTVDSIPSGSPLTLVWQTGGTPEEIMQDPIHLAMDAQGNIYVGSATTTGLIRVFDANGKFVTTWGKRGSGDGEFDFMLGIGIDLQGNVYVADFNRVRVNKFDSTGKFLMQWATEQPIGPSGLAVDTQGNVYVVNHRTHEHQIQKFDSNGQLLAEWGINGSGDGQIGAGGHSGPEDLAVDQQGNVYVADRVNNRIEKFDTNGNFLATIGTPGSEGQGQMSEPGDVTVDQLGNIYVLDAKFLQKFDPNGEFIAEWSLETDPLQDSGEVMVDAQGNVYVNATGDVYSTALKKNVRILVLKKFSQP